MTVHQRRDDFSFRSRNVAQKWDLFIAINGRPNPQRRWNVRSVSCRWLQKWRKLTANCQLTTCNCYDEQILVNRSNRSGIYSHSSVIHACDCLECDGIPSLRRRMTPSREPCVSVYTGTSLGGNCRLFATYTKWRGEEAQAEVAPTTAESSMIYLQRHDDVPVIMDQRYVSSQ